MKCVVTGGCGFIGSHLVDALVDRGNQVTVVDDLSTGDASNLNVSAEFRNVSVLDEDALRESIEGAAVVFHLAAWPRIPRSIQDPVNTHRVNVDGTLHVLEAARRSGVHRVVYSSSSSVYGAQRTHLMHEDMTPEPLSPYALQKLIGEQYASMYAGLYGMTVVSLRYFNVYGPRQPEEGAYALAIGKFLRLRREGQPLTVYGDGLQTRAYSHVDDVVRANLLAADTVLPASQNTILNIGTDRETSVLELANLMGGMVTHVFPNPRGEFEERRKAANYSRAAAVIGWRPRTRLEDALEALKSGSGVPAS